MSVRWGLVQQRGPWRETPKDLMNLKRTPDERVGGGTKMGGTGPDQNDTVLNPERMAPEYPLIGLLQPSNYAKARVQITDLQRDNRKGPIRGRGKVPTIKRGRMIEDSFEVGGVRNNNEQFHMDEIMGGMNDLKEALYRERSRYPSSLTETHAQRVSVDSASLKDDNSMWGDQSAEAQALQAEMLYNNNASFMEELGMFSVDGVRGMAQDERPSITGRKQSSSNVSMRSPSSATTSNSDDMMTPYVSGAPKNPTVSAHTPEYPMRGADTVGKKPPGQVIHAVVHARRK